METDRALWALAAAARGHRGRGVARRRTIRRTALAALPIVERRHGQRVAARPSMRSSTSTAGGPRACAIRRSRRGSRTRRPMLVMLTTFLRNGTRPRLRRGHGRRPSPNETRRSTRVRGRRSTSADLERFEAGLGACYHANFVVVAGGAQLLPRHASPHPVADGGAAHRRDRWRRATRRPDLRVPPRARRRSRRGTLTYADVRDSIVARRAYYEAGRARRSEMPRVLGTPNAGTDDPIMKEIFGVDQRLLEAVGAADLSTSALTGVPASSGVVRGRARVIRRRSPTSATSSPRRSWSASSRHRTGRRRSHRSPAACATPAARSRTRRSCRASTASPPCAAPGGDEADPHRRHDRGRRHGRSRQHPRARLGSMATTPSPRRARSAPTSTARCTRPSARRRTSGRRRHERPRCAPRSAPVDVETSISTAHGSCPDWSTLIRICCTSPSQPPVWPTCPMRRPRRTSSSAIARVAAARAPGEWVMATPVGEPHYFFRRGHGHLAEGDLPDRSHARSRNRCDIP